MSVLQKIKAHFLKNRAFLISEVKNEARTVFQLSLTFIGAGLVGRSAWGWIVDYYDRFVAFAVGMLLLILVAFISHHWRK